MEGAAIEDEDDFFSLGTPWKMANANSSLNLTHELPPVTALILYILT